LAKIRKREKILGLLRDQQHFLPFKFFQSNWDRVLTFFQHLTVLRSEEDDDDDEKFPISKF